MKFEVAVIIGLLGLSLLGMFAGDYEPNPQSAYVPERGGVVVLPQGQDPVYDQFYAQEVNPYNAESFKLEADAQLTKAEAERVRTETKVGMFGISTLLAIFGAIGLLFLVLVLKRGSDE